MKNKILAIVGLAISIGAASASAAIVSASDAQFSWTTDTASALDWLDFDGGPAPSTIGRTFNDVSSQLGGGGQYAGWRYATTGEVNTFIEHVSGVAFSGQDFKAAYNGVTNAVAAFTGVTDTGSGAFGGNGIFGITGTPFESGTSHFRVLLTDCDISSTCSVVDFWGDLDVQGSNQSFPNVGSWLVRETAPVPLPGAFWLLVPALGGLGAMRRRAA